MATIDIKLKSYDELIFEITKLNTDKYLLEQENKQLKERNKEIYDGFMVAIDEVCETDREKRKYKDRIDKAIEYIKENTDNTNFIEVPSKELLEILGDKE